MPEYSILVPVYNTEKYLKDCIDSVLNQTYQDFELILVDDGSTDSSPAICDSFAARDKRVRVIHTKNQGSILARKTALENAWGKYIFTLDSDDLIVPETVECVDSIFRKYNCDLVFYCFKYFSENSTDISHTLNSNRYFNNGDMNEIYLLLLSRRFNSLCNKCFRRDCFEPRLDFTKYSKIKNGEDFFITSQIIMGIHTAYYLDEPLYCYRQHNAGLSANYTTENLKLMSDLINDVRNLFIDYGYFNNEIERQFHVFSRWIVNSYIESVSFMKIKNHDKVKMIKQCESFDIFKNSIDPRTDKLFPRNISLKFFLLRIKQYMLLFRVIGIKKLLVRK